jgi:hypothetical protein
MRQCGSATTVTGVAPSAGRRCAHHGAGEAVLDRGRGAGRHPRAQQRAGVLPVLERDHIHRVVGQFEPPRQQIEDVRQRLRADRGADQVRGGDLRGGRGRVGDQVDRPQRDVAFGRRRPVGGQDAHHPVPVEVGHDAPAAQHDDVQPGQVRLLRGAPQPDPPGPDDDRLHDVTAFPAVCCCVLRCCGPGCGRPDATA